MKQSTDHRTGNAPQFVVMHGTASNVVDTTAPVLVSRPQSGHDPVANLVFVFNEPVKLGSGTLTLNGNRQVLAVDVANNPRLTVNGNTVSFDPPDNLAGQTIYTADFSLGAVLDLSGNPVVDPVNAAYGVVASFITGLSSVPVNVTGTDLADRIHGSELADTISGAGGNDTIYGYGGDDIIHGGDEIATVNPNGDTIYGGAGNDTLHGNRGRDFLYGDEGDDKLYGDADRDSLSGGAGNDLLDGGDGDDALRDDAGDNILLGGAGNDNLYTSAGTTGRQEGGDGNDTLGGFGGVHYFGGAGNDTINLTLTGNNAPLSTVDGGADDDRIVFNFDNPGIARFDVRGGSGIDTYAIATAGMAPDSQAQVRILDFSAGAGGDRIDLLALIGQDYPSNPFRDGLVRLAISGTDTLLQMRAEGAPDGYHTMLMLIGVAPGSLVRDNFVGAIDFTGRIDGLVLDGSDASDVLIGSAMDDTVRGHAGADRLEGRAGNDLLIGGAGNDLLEGGAGVDRAQYSGMRSDYTMTRSQTGVQLVDKRSGAPEGDDTLRDVERLIFADGHVAIDIDGVAGQAYRIYRAAFDREPDPTGMGFYLAMMDKGVSLLDVAASFVASQEFQAMYGSAPSNAEIVTRLYKNILHREPEPGGYTFWLGILDDKKATLAEVLEAFSEGFENRDGTAELIANGVPFTPYG